MEKKLTIIRSATKVGYICERCGKVVSLLINTKVYANDGDFHICLHCLAELLAEEFNVCPSKLDVVAAKDSRAYSSSNVESSPL